MLAFWILEGWLSIDNIHADVNKGLIKTAITRNFIGFLGGIIFFSCKLSDSYKL